MEQSGQKPAEQAPVGQQPAGQQQPKKSSNTALIIIVVVVVLGIVVLAGGYFVMRSIKARVSQKIGQKIGENMLEKAIEQGTGGKADVSADGNSVNVKTESGTFSASETGNIKLPSDFPSDVFVYGGAKITLATSTPANPADGTKASYMVGYEVNQSLNDVANKYRDEMTKNGWTKETEANYGAMMINFKKGTRETLVTISDSHGGQSGVTGVSVSVSEN
ncbi:MAG: hypothetical protein QMD77_04670 [Patescibacteria group bacterium]|nr:hypothetical protein [Patescibacteria group bacterium]